MNFSIENNTKLVNLWEEYTEIKNNNSNEDAGKKLEELFEYILDLNIEESEQFVDFMFQEDSSTFSQEFMLQIIAPILEEEVRKNK